MLSSPPQAKVPWALGRGRMGMGGWVGWGWVGGGGGWLKGWVGLKPGPWILTYMGPPWARDPHLYGSSLGPGSSLIWVPPWARDPHLYGSPLGPGSSLIWVPLGPGPGILTYMGPPWALGP